MYLSAADVFPFVFGTLRKGYARDISLLFFYIPWHSTVDGCNVSNVQHRLGSGASNFSNGGRLLLILLPLVHLPSGSFMIENISTSHYMYELSALTNSNTHLYIQCTEKYVIRKNVMCQTDQDL